MLLDIKILHDPKICLSMRDPSCDNLINAVRLRNVFEQRIIALDKCVLVDWPKIEHRALVYWSTF